MLKRDGRPTTRASIYYLGSKQSIGADISNALSEVTVGDGPVVDLFSGTGAVSRVVSEQRPVIAVDVQEYSRVLCSAVLEKYDSSSFDFSRFMEQSEKRYKRLAEIYESVLSLEEIALEKAHRSDLKMLAEIVECGCLLADYRSNQPTWLADAAERVLEARDSASIRDSEDMIARYFGGTYYSYRQALWLSALRSECSNLSDDTKPLAALLGTASLNASTVGGQLAQPVKAFDKDGNIKVKMLEKALRVRKSNILKSFKDSLSRLDALACPRSDNLVVKEECIEYLGKYQGVMPSAIYADPPYSRYHYSRYYHVLETIALNDSPQISLNPTTGQPSRGIYRAKRYQSPFSTRTGAHKAFESLFKSAANVSPTFILSYSPYLDNVDTTPRMAKIDELVGLAKSDFAKVDCRVLDGTRHSKLAGSKDILEAAKDAEVLIICQN